MHDRTYWRLCEMRLLLEAARDSEHELCIALGERLERYWYERGDVEQLRLDLEEMERSRNMWMREASNAMDALASLPELGREVIKQNMGK